MQSRPTLLMRSRALLLCLGALLPATVLAPAAHAARFFSPTSVWNSPVPPSSPLDTSSGALVAKLNTWVDDEVQRGVGPFINTTAYSTPIYNVGAGQPTTRVILDYGNIDLNAAIADVPLPSTAVPSKGTDGHLVVYQQATDTMWEFWRLR